MSVDHLLDLPVCAHQFYVLVLFLSVLVIPMCGRLSWPALLSTFSHTKNSDRSKAWILLWMRLHTLWWVCLMLSVNI